MRSKKMNKKEKLSLILAAWAFVVLYALELFFRYS
tara:strand:+ start:1128 stop:1232 length:105 start_codon:yes stop_codon:yes gene_type:complete